jgi:hypothetical protein
VENKFDWLIMQYCQINSFRKFLNAIGLYLILNLNLNCFVTSCTSLVLSGLNPKSNLTALKLALELELALAFALEHELKLELELLLFTKSFNFYLNYKLVNIDLNYKNGYSQRGLKNESILFI